MEEKTKDAIRIFSRLIERNKDRQAYSDYKERVNQGLEIARDVFEENNSKEDQNAKIKSLQDRLDLFLDTVIVQNHVILKATCTE